MTFATKRLIFIILTLVLILIEHKFVVSKQLLFWTFDESKLLPISILLFALGFVTVLMAIYYNYKDREANPK